MSKITADLAEKVREQARLVSVLELWGEVEAQGIDPEDVPSFTLRPEFFSQRQKMEYLAGKFTDGVPKTESKLRFYNAVRLKDGSLRKLDPMLRAR